MHETQISLPQPLQSASNQLSSMQYSHALKPHSLLCTG